MQNFVMFSDADSQIVSDMQLIEGLAPVALLLFGAGALTWVIDIIKHFWR